MKLREKISVYSFCLFFAVFPIFSYAAISDCMESVPSSDGMDGEENAQRIIDQTDPDSNPGMTLALCATFIPFVGVGGVLSECECKEAFKECSFDVRDMDVSGPAACVDFAPWNR